MKSPFLLLTITLLAALLLSCDPPVTTSPGERAENLSEHKKGKATEMPRHGFLSDSLDFPRRARNVLLTANPRYRLVPIFRMNEQRNYRGEKFYTAGSIDTHTGYQPNERLPGNNWNGHFLPGLEVAYGFNLVNVAVHTTGSENARDLFPQPALLQTLYYPAYRPDTLNGRPVLRDYYLVSAYPEDTNADGRVDTRDLRQLFRFDLDGGNGQSLLPPDYSVLSGTYDPANDHYYVYAQRNEQGDGSMNMLEPVTIFAVDLATGRLGASVYLPE